jgi:carboxyl-terminal processing protease
VAGVRAGDRLLAADGVPVSAVRDTHARVGDSTRLSAQRVRLTLWRAPHGDTVDVTVQRGAWHMPAVSEQGMLADSVGYVRLATISAGAADELEEVVDGLRHRGAQALVLDLRGNAGGLFADGVRAAGLFLPRGALVSSLMGRGGTDVQPYRVRHSRWSELPLTVLVDDRTASAAEVIAAALQDHGRALLVGAPTYGKGLVQRVVRLSPELALRLTTARWLTPRGVALERRTGKGVAARGGLAPDVLLDDASRADPAGVPVGWSASASRRAHVVADTLAMRALRHGWANRPLPLLEAHLRDSITIVAPAPRSRRAGRQATARAAAYAEWLAVTTRMAIVRVLEVQRESEALLRYAVREDAALREGLDVVAPGLTLSRR